MAVGNINPEFAHQSITPRFPEKTAARTNGLQPAEARSSSSLIPARRYDWVLSPYMMVLTCLLDAIAVSCSRESQVFPFLAGAFHITASVLTLTVFFWHFTPAAAKLPGCKGFGWFFKFLTFWGWTTQTVQFLLCVVHKCTSKSSKVWKPFTKFVDDFSCLAFTVAVVITVQFWVLDFVTGGLVERSEDRPPWLGFSVHVLNAILALTDIVLSNPRTFSRRADYIMLAFVGTYGCFLVLCRYHNGKYPYPFMNKLHPAASFLMMLFVSLVVLKLMSELGAVISAGARRALSKPELQLDAEPKVNGRTKSTTSSQTNGRSSAVRVDGPVLRNGKNRAKQI